MNRYISIRHNRLVVQCPVPLISALLSITLLWCAGDAGLRCLDTIRYTIPASAANTIAFLRETGLISHIFSMPLSAQRYFATQGLLFCVFSAFSVAAAVKTVRSIGHLRSKTQVV